MSTDQTDHAAEAIARIRNPWAQSTDIIVDPDEYDTCHQYARAALNATAAHGPGHGGDGDAK